MFSVKLDVSAASCLDILVSMFSISLAKFMFFLACATDAYSKLLDETFSVLLLELVPCDGLVGRAGDTGVIVSW